MPTPPVVQPAPSRTAETLENHQRFVAGFAERPDLLQGPDRLVDFRRAAIYALGETPFPTRRDEDWRYSDFTRALNADWSFADALAPDFDRADFEIFDFEGYVLVTVDGAFRPEFSDDIPGLTVGTIEQHIGKEPYAFWLDRVVSSLHAPDANAFVKLNAAFAKTGLFIACERNQRIDKSIHVIHLATRTSQPRFVQSQVMAMLAGGAQLTIDETFATLGEGEAIFRNHIVRGGIASNARLAYRSIQTEARTDYHHSNAHFDQQRDSFLDHARVDFGGAQVRNNLQVDHKAESLETYLAGMFFARGRQVIDNQTFIDHAFPHGESNELYKGIVMDRAVTSFNGKVMVRPDAQKTNAFQQNDNLVIGTKAEANAKPQLEIFADDVKCSHGATIGQMDEEPLYYLMARGIDRGRALSMLQRGFLLGVIERIESDAIRAHVETLLEAKFNE